MADIPPASAVQPAAPVNSSAGNTLVVETTVNRSPDKIAALARQIEINGTLSAPPGADAITLNTVIGPLVLALPEMSQAQQDKLLQQLLALFQNQKSLTVVLQPGNPPAQAFLLLPQAQPSAPTAPSVNITTTSLSTSPAALQPNTVLTAILLPHDISLTLGPSQALSAVSPSSESLPAEIALTLNRNVSLLETMEQESAGLGKIQNPSAPIPAIPIGSPALLSDPNAADSALLPGLSSSANAVLSPEGSEFTLRINAVYPPAAQATLPLPQGNQLLATVTGTGPGGQLILKSGDATLFVRQSTTAPPGTQLLITLEPASSGAPPILLTVPDRLNLSNLQQVFAALQQFDPTAARSLMANRMPQAGDNLAGALLFFLSAARQGDVRSWLGNGAIDLLTRVGKAELLSKLIGDMQAEGQTLRDSLVGDWKSYPLPLNDNGQLGIVHFYVHNERQHHGSGQGGEKDGPATPSQMRFLIDVRMKNLGPLQLDGFLRPKQLDIIIRSENQLPPIVGQELRQTFAQSLEAIGYNGGLNFQFGRQGWLTPRDPKAGAAIVT